MFNRRFSGTLLTVIVVAALSILIVGGLVPLGREGLIVIVVPEGFLEGLGYSHGVLQVSMLGVESFVSKHFLIEDVEGGTVEVDFSGPVGEWARSLERGVAGGIVNLPTVTITLYLYDGEGGLHVATLMYSAYDYYLERGSPRPGEEAAENPLAPFRKPLRIVLEPGEVKPVRLGLEVEGVLEALGLEEPPQPQPAYCEPSFKQVYWQWLYDLKDTPPEGWMERVVREDLTPAPDTVKQRLWEYFATEYSMARFYSVDVWSSGGAALRAAEMELGTTGLYDMDTFVDFLARKAGLSEDLRWLDSQPPTTVDIQVPYMLVKAYYYQNYPISMGGLFSVFKGQVMQTGITFLGKIVVGSEKVTTRSGAESIDLSGSEKAYIAVPATYKFLEDGFYLSYDVDKVYIAGCGYYWRVVPVFSFAPLYDVIDVRYDKMDHYFTSFDGPDPQDLPRLLYTYDLGITDMVVTAGPHEIIYKDGNKVVGVSKEESLGFMIVNLFRPWLEATLSAVLATASPAFSVAFTIASSFFGFTDVTVNVDAISYEFYIRTKNDDVDNLRLQVYKYTIRERADRYSEAGVTPVMIEYEVLVDPPSSGGPPCGPACPTG